MHRVQCQAKPTFQVVGGHGDFTKCRSRRRAVNLGNDADTTGAIYGQLAGTFYGVNAIPEDWIEPLTMRDFIGQSADALFDFSTA